MADEAVSAAAGEAIIVDSIPSTAVAVVGDRAAALQWNDRWLGEPRSPIALWLQNTRRQATRSAYLQAATAFAIWLGRDPLSATFADMLNYRDHLQAQGMASSSIISNLNRLSALFSFAVQQGFIRHSPIAGLQLPVKKAKRKQGAWSQEQIYRFWSAVTDDASESRSARLLHLRDAALLHLLWRNGLRVSEAAGANVGNLAREGAVITLHLIEEDGAEHVKGGYERRATMKPDTWEYVARYLEARGIDPDAVLAGTIPPEVARQPLFIGTRGNAGRPKKDGTPAPDQASGRISRHTIAQRVKVYGRAAKIPEHLIHPHAARHSFTTHLIRAKVPVHKVMIATGHKQMATIQKYIDLEESAADNAALELPY